MVGVPYQEAKELEGKGELFDCGKCNRKYNRPDLKIHYLEQHYNVSKISKEQQTEKHLMYLCHFVWWIFISFFSEGCDYQ